MHLNHNDILQTLDMIDHQHLDIRTITMGISLLDCADPNPYNCAEKIYDKICRTADYYRLVRGVPADTPNRYDVVGICGETIEWMKNAFPHRGAGIV